ncbi:TPA: glycoside hydrolase family 1 protein [Candidatus Moranbacteria bacterium]|nr:glycoside hydrolase family 1 protein [Candidatus Moranbacteria bacterium]
MLKKLKFPEGFLWGAATSSHQVEGGNKNNWTEWEKKNAERLAREAGEKWQKWQQEKFPEMFDPQNYISGRACDHYNLYEKDFDLAKNGGHNAHRFSIEWSRIEPEEGKFDEKEIEHYRKVIQALRDRNIEPLVTLWHWTHPLWVEEFGGPANKKFAEYFARYAKIMVENFGDLVKFWVTINEPMSVIPNCYLLGIWPPQKRNPLVTLRVYKNLADAHIKAYDILHQTNANAQVGFANILAYFEPVNPNSFLDKLVVGVAEYFGNKKFFNLTRSKNDFLALQYYFHNKLSFFGGLKNENKEVNDLGWEIYQEGLYHLLKFLGQYNLPIYITENGLADAKDEKRGKLIRDGLFWIYKAIQEGVNVQGFFYWSLLDNFEWDKGFWPRFGLIEIDYKTLERKPRKSFYEYAKICKSNELEIEIDDKNTNC